MLNSSIMLTVDVLIVSRWTKEEWRTLKLDAILNAWWHCFQSYGVSVQNAHDVIIETREEKMMDVRNHGVRYSWVWIDNLLNPADEDQENTENVYIQNQVLLITAGEDMEN